MAQIVRFEQDPEAPDGAGMFHFDSGASQYAYEPETAARISQLQSAMASAPDERVAGPGGGPVAAPIGPPSEADVVNRANAAVGGALASAAGAQAQQAMPPPPTPAEMGEQARSVAGQRAAEDILRGTKRVYHAGAPGVDPRAMVQNGVMVPTAGSMVTESGAPYSPEQAQERIGAAKDVRDAELAGMELQRQQTQNQLLQQRAVAPKLAAAAAQAEENHNRVLSAYRVDRSRLQQELDDYEKKAHVNPDHFFQDRGTFATIGMAIAQGLGAYASTMTGAPNFAYEMVQKAIDRDIAAQRDEIEAGRVSRRNKLAAMMDNYGFDLQQSEAAMRIAMNKSAEMQASMFANESKLPQYQVEAQKYNALSRQEIIKNEQALYNASIGKHTQTLNQAFVQPKAATGPGYTEKELTPEEMQARLKLLPKGTEPPATFTDLSPEKQVEITTKYGEGKAANASMRQAADEWAAAARGKDGKPLRVDWTKGVLVDSSGAPVTEGDFDVPGQAGPVGVDTDSVPIVGNREAVKAYDEATRRVLLARAKEAFGAATPEQVESLRPSALGSGERGAYRSLNSLIKSAHEKDRGLEQAYPGAVEQVNEQRQRETNRRRKGSPGAVKVTEY